MPSLRELQTALKKHLIVDDASIFNYLSKPPQGPIADRLAVYSNGYRWRLIDTLQNAYHVLSEYLGNVRFQQLAEAYIDQHPSRFYSLKDFTKLLPDFLQLYCSQQAYLSELARLISCLSRAVECADAPVLSQATLANITPQIWPSVCFKLHPSVQCLEFEWNTFSLWKALTQKTVLPKLICTKEYCIVWRKEQQAYANKLNKVELIIYQACRVGTCFSDLCEAVHSASLVDQSATATSVAHCLMQGVSDHLFSEVSFS